MPTRTTDRQREHIASLRYEAQPREIETLTADQARALEKVNDGLAALAAEQIAKPVDGPGFLPRIDRVRPANVFLIEGDRGTGKTTLLLSVLDPLRRRIGSGRDAEPNITRASLDQVVPLEIVDLGPLPAHAPLVLHIAGQLRLVIDWIDERRGSRPALTNSPLDIGGSSESDTLWAAFVRAAVTPFDGGFATRGGQLDPSAYTVEAEELARGRLDVARAFRAAVDALATAFMDIAGWGPERRPLFAIPVDDADMSVQHIPHLMDMLRTLYHPRVAFLVTGHAQQFIDVLDSAFRESVRDRERRATLARQIVEKVFPFAQRAFLPPLEARERLTFLSGLMRRFQLEDAAPSRLEQLLGRFLPLQHALPDRVRELLELEGSLRGPRDPENPDDAHVRELVHRAREAELLPSSLGRTIDRERLVGLSPIARGQRSSWTARRMLRPPIGGPEGRGLRAFALGTVSFGGPSERRRAGSQRLAAAVLLARVWDDLRDVPLQKRPLSRGYPPVIATSTVDRVRRDVAWPLPADWGDFEVLAFDAIWTTELARRLSPGLDLAALFVEAVSAIEVARHPSPGDLIDVQLADFGRSRTWEVVVENLANTPGEWAKTRVKLLAAPEYGLGAERANLLIRHVSAEMASRLSELRSSALAGVERRAGRAAARADVVAIEDSYDAASAKHAWGAQVSGMSPARSRLQTERVDRLADALAKFRAPATLTLPGVSYLTIQTYLGPSRRSVLATARVDVLDALDGAVRARPGGYRALILRDLYAAASRAEREDSDLVQVRNGQIAVTAKLEREVSRREDVRIPVSGGRHVVLHQVDVHLAGPRRRPASDVVLRMAYDVSVDARDADELTSPPVFAWPGIDIEVAGRRFSWPAPNWPALLDLEEMIEDWNLAVQQLALLADEPDEMTRQRYVDALASWFIELCENRAGRHGTRRFDLAAPDSTHLHRTLGVEVWAERPARSNRGRAYETWRSMRVLLAAPECGLSADVANVLLEHLPTSAAIVSQWRGAFARLLNVENVSEALRTVDELAAPGFPKFVSRRKGR